MMSSFVASTARRRLPPLVLDAIADSPALAVCVLFGAVVESATPGVDAILGDGAGAIGCDLAALATPDDREPMRSRLEAFARSSEPSVKLGLHVLHPERGVRDIELLGLAMNVGGERRCLAWLTDRTDQRRVETQLAYLAYLDALTGLPNRAHFTDQLSKTLTTARKSARMFALLMVDLDGFKAVNDTHGHEMGDALLQVVAQRLGGCSRHSDTVARLGGDEFALILPHLRAPEDAAIVAGRIVRSLEEPIVIGRVTCRIGASVGIAAFPEHANDTDSLSAAADAAMYDAKRAGKGRYRLATGRESAPPPTVEFLSWNDAHALGIEALDAQHRGIMDRINRLGREMNEGLELDALLTSLRGLVQASEAHFAFEEALMTEHGLRHAVDHAAVHRRLLDDVRSLTTGLDERGLVLTMRYLQQWLFRHVDTTDRAMGKELRALGVH
jgi:diguanylate cyclase (GGDEF)-like protein/hemerythrin-like metal-binding protein